MKIRIPENKSHYDSKVRRMIFKEVLSYLECGISLAEMKNCATDYTSNLSIYVFRDYNNKLSGWERKFSTIEKYVRVECRKMDNKDKIKEILK